jgi:[NiFe] hydrogenase assembly HybE family chaperone
MTSVLHREDPTALVEAAFTRIWHERMEGLPILHPALAVEAVDLQRFAGQWLGVLVTPWMMSVLLLPAEAGAWVHVRVQQRRFVKFPFGDLAFLGGDEAGLGEYQACSLFSPMDRFATQAEARETAKASVSALLVACHPHEGGHPEQQPPAAEPAQAQGSRPCASDAVAVSARDPIASRRRFLRLGL